MHRAVAVLSDSWQSRLFALYRSEVLFHQRHYSESRIVENLCLAARKIKRDSELSEEKKQARLNRNSRLIEETRKKNRCKTGKEKMPLKFSIGLLSVIGRAHKKDHTYPVQAIKDFLNPTKWLAKNAENFDPSKGATEDDNYSSLLIDRWPVFPKRDYDSEALSQLSRQLSKRIGVTKDNEISVRRLGVILLDSDQDQFNQIKSFGLLNDKPSNLEELLNHFVAIS